jgi:hypothetical protein
MRFYARLTSGHAADSVITFKIRTNNDTDIFKFKSLNCMNYAL